MALLIKGAHVYAPEDLGICDVLTVGKQVVAVGKDLTATLPELETIDAKGLILTPGFIDQHIHVTGGGGEGGPKTRTPELVLSELIACGTTSVVGVSVRAAPCRTCSVRYVRFRPKAFRPGCTRATMPIPRRRSRAACETIFISFPKYSVSRSPWVITAQASPRRKK